MLYSLFDAGTIDWIVGLTEQQIITTASLFANTTFYASIAYTLFIAGLVCTAISLRSQWKQHGWIVVACILVLLYVPVEVYLQYIDYDMLKGIENGASLEHIKESVLTRVKGAGLYSGLSLLSYVSAAIVCVWQPLKMKGNA